MSHELKAVAAPEDWEAMHRIRRATLFAPGRHPRGVIYDENHPDDRHPDKQCFLLLLDQRPMGVVRLDRREPEDGVVRLVAVVPELQRQQHGRAMSDLLDTEARSRAMRRLFVNAHINAVGFYEKTGWVVESWDPAELIGIASRCVQMAKTL